MKISAKCQIRRNIGTKDDSDIPLLHRRWKAGIWVKTVPSRRPLIRKGIIAANADLHLPALAGAKVVCHETPERSIEAFQGSFRPLHKRHPGRTALLQPAPGGGVYLYSGGEEKVTCSGRRSRGRRPSWGWRPAR